MDFETPSPRKREIIDNWVISWELTKVPYMGEQETMWDGNVYIRHPVMGAPRMFFIVSETRSGAIILIHNWIREIVWEIIQDIQKE